MRKKWIFSILFHLLLAASNWNLNQFFYLIVSHIMSMRTETGCITCIWYIVLMLPLPLPTVQVRFSCWILFLSTRFPRCHGNCKFVRRYQNGINLIFQWVLIKKGEARSSLTYIIGKALRRQSLQFEITVLFLRNDNNRTSSIWQHDSDCLIQLDIWFYLTVWFNLHTWSYFTI